MDINNIAMEESAAIPLGAEPAHMRRDARSAALGPRRDDALRRTIAVAALAAVAAGVVAALALHGPGLWKFFTDAEAVRAWVDAQGAAAPFAMIGLVAVQVVVAVLPGEPIELAAGYLFGFWGGTAVCLAGGVTGTLCAIALVRLFGMRAVRLFFSRRQVGDVAWPRGSSRFDLLMFVAFLIPGTPKDLLTYAAGMMPCPWWKIALITTAGRIPSIATSTLAAGFISRGMWGAAGISIAVTVVLAAVGVAGLAALRSGED